MDPIEVLGKTADCSKALYLATKRMVKKIPPFRVVIQMLKTDKFIEGDWTVEEKAKDIISFSVSKEGIRVTVLIHPLRVGIEGNPEIIERLIMQVDGKKAIRYDDGRIEEVNN